MGWVVDSAADVRTSEWIEAELDARGGEVPEPEYGGGEAAVEEDC